MFWKKKYTFQEYSKKVRELLEKGRYEKALARYNKLKYLFKKLPKDKKLEHEKEFESLKNQLLMYLKIEELRELIKQDNLGLVEEGLNYINYLLSSTENIPEKYFKFVDSTYNEFLRELNYRLILEELNKELEQVYKLRDEKNFDGALFLFPDVMKKYKELEVYSKDDDVYNMLMKLREQLKFEVLKSEAYGSVAKVDTSILKKALRKKEVGKARELYNKLFKIN